MHTTSPEFDTTVGNYFGLPNNPSGDVYGIEMELEQLYELINFPKHCQNVTEDHSLRNNGMEFISKPVSLEDAVEFFVDTLTTEEVKWSDKTKRCTERGSVHVHVNVKHFSIAQLRKFLRFYCILEPEFFAFVHESRRNNIYCVPLAATQMPKYIQRLPTLGNIVESWHKYTALNVKCLSELGTVEFRHLEATENECTFRQWLGFIHQLKEATRAFPDNLSWDNVHVLHHFVFSKPMEQVEDIKASYQEDLINRLNISPKMLAERIKESKRCVA